MFFKKLRIVFILYLCFSIPAVAQSYSCTIKQNGYAHALNALGGSLNKKLKYAKSWMPENFMVSADYLEFDNFEPLKITGGNRDNSFQANLTTPKYRVSYKVNINKHTGTGKVYMQPQNYKRVGPAFYLCTQDNLSVSNEQPSQKSVKSRSVPKGITDDMRYYFKVFSNEVCIKQISNWFKQNHEIYAIIFGSQIIASKDFTVTNSKQSNFKKLALMNNRQIRLNHKSKIISMLDYRRSKICQADYDRISDPIFRGLVRSADEKREALIKKIESNKAKYADVTLLIANENSQYEDMFIYWEAKDPDGLSELSNEMDYFLRAFQRITSPVLQTLKLHYGIN